MYINKVIDAHLHITENGKWFGQEYDASLEALLEQMAATGVDAGIILALTELKQNEYIRRVCEGSGGKLYALASFSPLTQDINMIREYLSLDVFSGIKLHPRRDIFSPRDERIFPFYEEAEENGWPLNFDTLAHTAALPMEELRPSVFDKLAKRFPKLKMVLSHCGTPWIMEAFFAAKSNPNIYLDCSFILDRYRDSTIFTDLIFTAKYLDRKLIYGSDFPEENVNRYLSLARVEFRELTEEKKANIFGKNATSVYALK